MSPKNKGTFGRGKPPITDQDEFITGVQTTAERLKPYVPHIVVGAGAILLLALGFAIVSWIGDRRAKAATESFSEVVAVTGQRVGMPMFIDGELTPPEYDTASARAEAGLARLEDLRESHGSTQLGSRARLLEGKLLLDLGRYEDARAAYEAVAESDAPAILRVQAREGIGYSYEEEAFAADDAAAREQGLGRALERFEQLQPREDGPMRAHALYHQGRLLAAMGRTDEAIERLEEGRDLQGGGIGVRAEIDDRLALLRSPGGAAPPPRAHAPSAAEDVDGVDDGGSGSSPAEAASEADPAGDESDAEDSVPSPASDDDAPLSDEP